MCRPQHGPVIMSRHAVLMMVM